MKNKSILLLPVFVLAALVGLGILLSGCSKGEQTKTLYTCGMHPQVVQDHPGNCPICQMKLTPIRKPPAATTNASAERKIKFYKSTMKAGEISQSPGKDSMGRDMVPVYEDEAADKNLISIDSGTRQSMNLRIGVVTNGPLRRVVRSPGVVDFDETSLAEVTTKYKGWIEKLHVDSTGVQVHRGDP